MNHHKQLSDQSATSNHNKIAKQGNLSIYSELQSKQKNLAEGKVREHERRKEEPTKGHVKLVFLCLRFSVIFVL